MANTLTLTPNAGAGLQQPDPASQIALTIVPVMRGPSGAATVDFPAAVALSGQRAVYQSSTGLRYASADAAASCHVIGITTASTAAGQSASVQTLGALTDPSWTWLVNQPIWLGLNGQLTQLTPASPAATSNVELGTAIASDTVFIRIHPPINLI